MIKETNVKLVTAIPGPKSKALVEERKKYVANGEGLILSGSYGTMKTTLAICVLRKYIEQGGRGLFVPMCSIRTIW